MSSDSLDKGITVNVHESVEEEEDPVTRKRNWSLKFQNQNLEREFAYSQLLETRLARIIGAGLMSLAAMSNGVEAVFRYLDLGVEHRAPLSFIILVDAFHFSGCLALILMDRRSVISKKLLHPFIYEALCAFLASVSPWLICTGSYYRSARMFDDDPMAVWGTDVFTDSHLLLLLVTEMFSVLFLLPRTFVVWVSPVQIVLSYLCSTMILGSPESITYSGANLVLLTLIAVMMFTTKRTVEKFGRCLFLKQRQTTQALSMAERSLSSFVDASFVLSATAGVVASSNKKLDSIFCCKMNGRPMSEMLSENSSRLEEFLKHIHSSNSSQKISLGLRDNRGATFEAELFASPLEDSNKLMASLVQTSQKILASAASPGDDPTYDDVQIHSPPSASSSGSSSVGSSYALTTAQTIEHPELSEIAITFDILTAELDVLQCNLGFATNIMNHRGPQLTDYLINPSADMVIQQLQHFVNTMRQDGETTMSNDIGPMCFKWPSSDGSTAPILSAETALLEICVDSSQDVEEMPAVLRFRSLKQALPRYKKKRSSSRSSRCGSVGHGSSPGLARGENSGSLNGPASGDGSLHSSTSSKFSGTLGGMQPNDSSLRRNCSGISAGICSL